MPGSERRDRRARASSALRSTANGATPKPWPARNVFSLIRSCAIATLAAAGVTRASRARNSSAAAGTFSNSVVAARHERRELGEAARIEVVGANVAVGDASRRAVVARIEHRHLVAEALRGHAEHAARAGRRPAAPATRRARRRSQRAPNRAARRSASGGAARASRARRRSASRGTRRALRERRVGRRQQRDGEQRRRWRRPPRRSRTSRRECPSASARSNSSESSPRRYFDGTGTPSTGTVVFAASMPGQVRGAAGAGDDRAQAARTRRPRRTRTCRRASGAPTGRALRTATPNASSWAAAWRMISQSLSLPITTPTSGAALRCAIAFSLTVAAILAPGPRVPGCGWPGCCSGLLSCHPCANAAAFVVVS